MAASDPWPELPYEGWRDTLETVHRWAQIVGKVRLARAPMTDGWWQVPLYLTARGLTTSPIPASDRVFDLTFDFVAHELRLDVSDGTSAFIALQPRPVCNFYDAVMRHLEDAALATPIWPVPVELLEPNPEPFDRDRAHASYDADAVHRWWRILVQTDQVLKEVASRFVGRVSPVQFYWGTFDLALSRYSGRRVEPPPDAGVIERYAFDEEQVECGFWPGDERLPAPAFFAFASPPPSRAGSRREVVPSAAHFDTKLGEYVLLYDDVRRAPDPRRALLDFFQSAYEAEATAPSWDHAKLDWQPPRIH